MYLIVLSMFILQLNLNVKIKVYKTKFSLTRLFIIFDSQKLSFE